MREEGVFPSGDKKPIPDGFKGFVDKNKLLVIIGGSAAVFLIITICTCLCCSSKQKKRMDSYMFKTYSQNGQENLRTSS